MASHKSSVFISYGRADDEPFAKRLYADLLEANVSVWWDRECMENRGRTFLQELRDAIDSVERVIAVIGPRAVVSEYVRSEWGHAALFGKGVVPILRMGSMKLLPPELAKLHCLDMTSDDNYAEGLEELLKILSSPLAALGPFLTPIPALPSRFQNRTEDVSGLLSDLLCDLESPIVVSPRHQTVVVSGIGGIGKSVIAAAMCRSVDVRRAFENGILWLGVGVQPDLLRLIRTLGSRLGDDLAHYTDLDSAVARMPACLENKRLLIVLDDVWQIECVTPFLNALRPQTRLMITSRDKGLLPGARSRDVGTFDLSTALSLLADWSGEPVDELPTTAKEIASECGLHPFALALCGSMRLELSTPWEDMIDALRNADLRFLEGVFPNYEKYDSILRCLQVSVDGLARNRPEAVERYHELAVFRYDLGLTENSVATLWKQTAGFNAAEARKLLSIFARLSLVSIDLERVVPQVSMHDLQLDYLKSTTKNLQTVERQLVSAYRELSPTGWHDGPDDGYFFRALPHHLAASGAGGELTKLLLSYRWIKRKLGATGALSVLNDFEMTKEDPDLNLVQSALSNSLPTIRRAEQLPTQLHGRLLGSASKNIRSFLTEAMESTDQPWLRPLAFSLFPAGLQLLRAVAADPEMDRMAISDSGQVVLLACMRSRSGRVAVCDFERDTELAPLDAAAGPVFAFAVSPNGKLGVVSSDEGGTEIWDLEARKKTGELAGWSECISAMAFDRKGNRLFTGSWEGKIKLWDLETMKEVRTIATARTKIWSIAVNDSLTHCLAGLADGSANLWQIDSGACVAEFKYHKQRVGYVALSQDARHAITAELGQAALWDLDRASSPMTYLTNGLDHVGASADCRFVLLGGKQVVSTGVSFDDPGSRLVRTLRGVGDRTMCLAATRDHSRAATVSKDGVLRLWDLTRVDPLPIPLQISEISRPEIYEIDLTPDRNHAFARCLDGSTSFYDLDNSFLCGAWRTDDCERIFSVVDVGREPIVLATTKTGDLHIINLTTEEKRVLLPGIDPNLLTATITSDLKHAVWAERDGDLRMLEVDGLKEVKLTMGLSVKRSSPEANELPARLVESLQLGRETDESFCVAKWQSLMVLACRRELVIWDIERDRLYAHFTADSPLKMCALSEDNVFVVALDGLDRLHVFQIENGR